MPTHTAQGYPPTHHYTVVDKRLLPLTTLAERVTLIERHFPEMLSGIRLLDIGCSRGYMTISYGDNFEFALGIDTDVNAIGCANRSATEIDGHGLFDTTSFRNFHDADPFDKILLLNGPHHLYREIGDHEWVHKLAALSSGYVLTEGPMDRTCSDFGEQPDIYKANFDQFAIWMQLYFRQIRFVPSVSYTPGRYMILWQRHVSWSKLCPKEYPLYKKEFRHDELVDNDPVTVAIAASSPISNGILGFHETGWYEHESDVPPYKVGENAKAIWRALCKHQVFLAKLGYTDIDTGTINFFSDGLTLFDKSGVMPIRALTPQHVEAYMTVLKSNHGSHLSHEEQEQLGQAMLSRDPDTIQRIHECLVFQA